MKSFESKKTQNFKKLMQEAEDMSKQLQESFKGPYEAIKEKFHGQSITEAFTRLKGLPQQVCLLTLSLLFPELSTKLSNLASIPLSKFTLTKDAIVYLDALIKSGVAADVERGVVFIMGKSGVGKSSFANTFKRFIENPGENPISVLTENNKQLLETQVLEVYDEIHLQQTKKLAINLESLSSKVKLVNFKEDEVSNDELSKRKQLKLQLLDFGGQHEYRSCLSLFMSSSGVILICFDSSKLTTENAEEQYYSSVGSYIDFLRETAIGSKIQPKIMLVATKYKKTKESIKTCDKVLELAKAHVKSLETETPIILVNEVLKTCSEEVTKEMLEEQYVKLSTLCTDEQINEKQTGTTPAEWFNVLDKIKPSTHLTFNKFVEVYKKVKQETKGATNISNEDLGDLKKFREIVVMIEDIEQENTEDKKGNRKMVLVNTSEK